MDDMWISGSRVAVPRFVRPRHRGVAAMENDLTYYRRRSAEESARAVAAPDAKVRQVHLDLARGYDDRVTALEAKHLPLGLHVVSA